MIAKINFKEQLRWMLVKGDNFLSIQIFNTSFKFDQLDYSEALEYPWLTHVGAEELWLL